MGQSHTSVSNVKALCIVDFSSFPWHTVELGFGAQINLGTVGRVAGDHLGNVAFRIVEIAKYQGFGGADFDAGGLLPGGQIGLPTKVTFVCRLRDRVDETHMVRTGGNAVAAAYAALVIDVDDTGERIFERCPCWADGNAGRVLTVLTGFAEKLLNRTRFLDGGNIDGLQYIQAGNAIRNVIRFFAGLDTGFTSIQRISLCNKPYFTGNLPCAFSDSFCALAKPTGPLMAIALPI